MRKLRLVKVAVQPVFVIDDGKTIEEVNHPPVMIPAAEWETYSTERFPLEVAAWQKELDQEDAQRKVVPSREHVKARKRRAAKPAASKP